MNSPLRSDARSFQATRYLLAASSSRQQFAVVTEGASQFARGPGLTPRVRHPVAPTGHDTSVPDARGGVSEKIDQYQPQAITPFVWGKIDTFVRDAVGDVPGLTDAKAQTYATVLTRHAAWCWQTCAYPLERDIILAPAVIAESIERLDGFTDASRRTFRSRLLAMSDALTTKGTGRAKMPLISRSLQSAPYTATEVATLRSWAGYLGTDYRRVNCMMALALGLGAGLTRSEVGHLRASDVLVDDIGVMLSIGGTRPRQVPMLTEWAPIVGDLAGAIMRKQQYLLGPRVTDRDSKNLIANLLRHTKPPVPLTTHRMRATWIVGHLAAGIPATTLAKAAGLENTAALRLYLPFIPELDQREYRIRLHRGQNLFGGDTP